MTELEYTEKEGNFRQYKIYMEMKHLMKMESLTVWW